MDVHKFFEIMKGVERITQLLIVVIFTGVFFVGVDFLFGSQLLERFLFPPKLVDGSYGGPDWKALFQLLIFTFGLPIALLLWYWRDRNVRDQIENSRKDTNLKEFDAVQIRLAGGLDHSIPKKARENLQVAALFQLSSFLNGQRGKDFVRPAYEAFRAKLEADYEDVVGDEFHKNVDRLEAVYDKLIRSNNVSKKHRIVNYLHQQRNPISELRREFRNNHRTNVNNEFFRANLSSIIEKNIPLDSINLSFLSISVSLNDLRFLNAKLIGTAFHRGDFRDCEFTSCNMTSAHLVNSVFRDCRFHSTSMDLINLQNSIFENCGFDGAKMRGVFISDTSDSQQKVFKNCSFQFSDMSFSQFGSIDFANSDLSGATLVRSSFDNCNLEGADLSNCDMRGAHMTRIDPRTLKSCEGAIYDADTWFHLPTSSDSLHIDTAKRQYLESLWMSCGAKPA